MSGFARNVSLLATGQALALSGNSLIVTTAPLVGLALALDKSFAALPIAALFVATLLTSIPAALLMGRLGRKAGFALASVIGGAGGGVAAWAVLRESLILFSFGMFLVGVFNGFANHFRFAATDGVEPERRGAAISWVLIGGVVAAVAGPSLARVSRDAMEPPFFASYAILVGIYAACLVAVFFLRLPPLDVAVLRDETPPRRLTEIVKQPLYVAAMVCATFGYAAMTLMMTATPLAMKHHGHTFADTAWVIQWHILGMFAPSLITARLIRRFGFTAVLLAGALLEGIAVLVNLLGETVAHFYAALICLGIGWNFLFIGATTLLTQTHTPPERARAQGFNDLVVFSTVAAAALSSSVIQHRVGWQWVNVAVVPMLAAVVLSIAWAARQRDSAA